MTKEEAIECLNFQNEKFFGGQSEALKMAIECLSSQNEAMTEKEVSRCYTCWNVDDEFSGECYECVKGIFDHYAPRRSVPNE